MVAARGPFGDGCSLRIVGNADLHRRLTPDAMIAPWVIKGAMDGSAFAAYVKKVLVPELEPGTVVILDNLATHKNAVAAKAMRDAGCWFLFLPPYSRKRRLEGTRISAWRLEVPGKQIVDEVLRMARCDGFERRLQIGEGFDAVDFCSLDQ